MRPTGAVWMLSGGLGLLRKASASRKPKEKKSFYDRSMSFQVISLIISD
jgi:hypothetical protein